jgi:hypothetical protein
MYLRDVVKGQTIQINSPVAGVPRLSHEEREQLEDAHFQLASTDGSKIFFTDTVRLTPDSKLTPTQAGPADLYECEVVEVAGSLECNLKDLTAIDEFGKTADVVGTMLGASEHGDSLYFVANGVLAPGATQGHCARPATAAAADPSAHCNLYVDQYDSSSKTWRTRFITSLSQEDAPDWGSTGRGSLQGLTSRVSPNGRFVAFMSDQPLTAYNNVDVKPQAAGARDEEVFVYDTSKQRLTCVSCKQGTQPDGVLDTEKTSEGVGLLVDLPGVWRAGEEGKASRWLAGSIPGWTPVEPNTAPYNSRYLSNDGRLFFNSADALASQDVNGKEDVYEYEPESLGSCTDSSGCVSLISSGTSSRESAFIDASTSGNDAFFVSAAQLVPGDRDKSIDLYDARVCTDASPCLESALANPSRCELEPNAENCKGPGSPQSVFPPPASSTFSGPVSVAHSGTLPIKVTKPALFPLTRAQKLKKALGQCNKRFKHNKKKLTACRKQAYKKYGPKKPAKQKAKKK